MSLISPSHAVSEFLFTLIPEYACGVCRREAGVGAEEESGACKSVPSVEFAPAAPGPLLAASTAYTLGGTEGMTVSLAYIVALSSSAKGLGWRCCASYKILLTPTGGFLLHRECALAGVTVVP